MVVCIPVELVSVEVVADSVLEVECDDSTEVVPVDVDSEVDRIAVGVDDDSEVVLVVFNVEYCVEEVLVSTEDFCSDSVVDTCCDSELVVSMLVAVLEIETVDDVLVETT